MKTASTMIQAIALTACFAAYAAGTGELKSGVRRAMQTIGATVEMPASQSDTQSGFDNA
ncbi:hypothetical protein FQ775_23705 [Nitratireductor mangrovi]|uniref:Uncharacterized protein n=1 Tax=Nitratireductor mangrovi TaxID=2599600 RepID=A0A6H0DZS4_9HYPH|nr:hypothetical protein [Nitratireductor mangrovi]QIS94614.1 hypothetical protein FQ775_23705 [Nitratireductor mangrovi]